MVKNLSKKIKIGIIITILILFTQSVYMVKAVERDEALGNPAGITETPAEEPKNTETSTVTFNISFKNLDDGPWNFTNYEKLYPMYVGTNEAGSWLNLTGIEYEYKWSNKDTQQGITNEQGMINYKPTSEEASESVEVTLKNLPNKTQIIFVVADNTLFSNITINNNSVPINRVAMYLEDGVIKIGPSTASVDKPVNIELTSWLLSGEETPVRPTSATINLNFLNEDDKNWNFDLYKCLGEFRVLKRGTNNTSASASNVNYTYEWSNGETGTGSTTGNGKITLIPPKNTSVNSVTINIDLSSDEEIAEICSPKFDNYIFSKITVNGNEGNKEGNAFYKNLTVNDAGIWINRNKSFSRSAYKF